MAPQISTSQLESRLDLAEGADRGGGAGVGSSRITTASTVSHRMTRPVVAAGIGLLA